MDAETVHRRRWWILVVLCFSLLVIVLDNTILNVALPTLVRDLDATNSELQWIVDAYTLVFAGLLLTAGSLGDRFGRRGALSLGLVIFGLGSGLSALADDAAHLVATRALMGVGGAFIMPSTLSILTNVFTGRERGRAIGIWAGVSGLAVALGPLAGGFLLEHFFWGSVFLVNVPVVIVAVVAGRLLVPTSRDPSAPRLDPVGAVLSITGLGVLLFAIIEAPERGWGDGFILATFGVAVLVLGAFAVWELRSDHPMLDVHFFENPRFTSASAAITLVFFAMFGSLFLLTQYLQFVMGYTALQTGVRLLPMALTLMVVAPLSARLVERLGTKVVVGTGLSIAATGLLLFTRTTVDSGLGTVLLAYVVMAAGMGLTMAPATESIMGSLPLAKAGVGSAVNDTTRQLGGALGVAVLGSVLATGYGSSAADAARDLGVSGPAVGAVGESLGGALEVAAGLGGAAGDALAAAAKAAFVDGMHTGVVVAAIAALIGAVQVLRWLPARARDDVPVAEEARTGDRVTEEARHDVAPGLAEA